ncbi:MAG: Nif11-like leader peptide family natural product precursor [Gemmatimonadota bacterium]|nr:MAG: Nif11-like leader peptide family natural product precursor [Gemmatimonadota bacterium]
MSLETVAAFLHRATHDAQLQKELAAVADRHGFLFSPEELGELDIEALTTAFRNAAADVALPYETEEDDPFDPGFGIIEIPA